CGEGRQEAGAEPGNFFLWHEATNDRASLVDRPTRVDPKSVDVSGKGKAPPIAHLHRQLGFCAGRKRDRRGYRQQNDSHHCAPPAEVSRNCPPLKETETSRTASYACTVEGRVRASAARYKPRLHLLIEGTDAGAMMNLLARFVHQSHPTSPSHLAPSGATALPVADCSDAQARGFRWP